MRLIIDPAMSSSAFFSECRIVEQARLLESLLPLRSFKALNLGSTFLRLGSWGRESAGREALALKDKWRKEREL